MSQIKNQMSISKSGTISTKDDCLSDKNSSDEEENFKEKNISHPAMKFIFGHEIGRK